MAPRSRPSLHYIPGAKEIRLEGLTVRLGRPIEVTKQIGWGMEWAHNQGEPSWSFIHLTPYMDRFPDGNLIVTYAMDPDTQVNPICLSAFQISKDQGRSWGRRYTVVMQHNPAHLRAGKKRFAPRPSQRIYPAFPGGTHHLRGAGLSFRARREGNGPDSGRGEDPRLEVAGCDQSRGSARG